MWLWTTTGWLRISPPPTSPSTGPAAARNAEDVIKDKGDTLCCASSPPSAALTKLTAKKHPLLLHHSRQNETHTSVSFLSTGSQLASDKQSSLWSEQKSSVSLPSDSFKHVCKTRVTRPLSCLSCSVKGVPCSGHARCL